MSATNKIPHVEANKAAGADLIYSSLAKLLFSLLHFLARLLPPALLLNFCGWIGGLVRFFCPRELEIIEAQVNYAKASLAEKKGDAGQIAQAKMADDGNLPLQNHSAAEIARQVFVNTGRAVGELLLVEQFIKTVPQSGPIPFYPPSVVHMTSEGDEIAQHYISQGRGGVGLSAHFGCFELLAAYLVRRGYPITVIGRMPNYPWLGYLIDSVRKSYGVRTAWRSDQASIKSLLKSLREGRFLAVLIDQDTNIESQHSPFFGLPAACPIGPIRLALQFKLPVLTSIIVRTGPLESHVITEDIAYDPADPNAAQFILDTYHQRLEKLIHKYPDQWLWWHRRWRRRPGIDYQSNTEGLLRSTKDYLAWLKQIPKE